MPNVARWTRDEVLALPADENRYELFDGNQLEQWEPVPGTEPLTVDLVALFHELDR